MAHDRVEFESYWDQRKVGNKTLEVTRDFDFAILAVGLGVVPMVCSELVKHDRRWRNMVENVETVATQAFQLWLDVDMEEMGWSLGPVSLSAFVEPFDTWAEMNQLIPEESFPVAPRSIAYSRATSIPHEWPR